MYIATASLALGRAFWYDVRAFTFAVFAAVPHDLIPAGPLQVNAIIECLAQKTSSGLLQAGESMLSLVQNAICTSLGVLSSSGELNSGLTLLLSVSRFAACRVSDAYRHRMYQPAKQPFKA